MLDIESALQKIDEVASNQEGIAAEEALILRGCVTSRVGLYGHVITHSRFCLTFPKVLNLINSMCIQMPWNV